MDGVAFESSVMHVRLCACYSGWTVYLLVVNGACVRACVWYVGMLMRGGAELGCAPTDAVGRV